VPGHGVTSSIVEQRLAEIDMRMALGAVPGGRARSHHGDSVKSAETPFIAAIVSRFLPTPAASLLAVVRGEGVPPPIVAGARKPTPSRFPSSLFPGPRFSSAASRSIGWCGLQGSVRSSLPERLQ
jgi:hypothetical protein